MNETIHHRPTLDQLAEEFADRYRRGEKPTVEEFAAAHPDLASEIRDLFPTLAMMEELAPSGATSEPEASARGSSIVIKPLDRIGDFRILREIGRGGMGVVYEAEQESLGRRVALKVLPLHSASDPKMLARFRRESRAAGQLHHTNIVPIFEVGEYGDICWYAMQFIPGQALDEVVKELQRLRAGKSTEPVQPSPLTLSLMEDSPVHGPDVNTTDAYRPIAPETGCAVSDSTPMPQSVRCNEEIVELDFRLCCRNVSRIGLQVADALTFAHARGIVHRDIKPSNLLLDTSGIVWVTDFGLAKTQEHALTETGDIVGTVRYMAPERFRGECDARSDVYSLGVTMYELLTLKPAFDNSDRLKLIESIGNQEPIKPRAIEPQVPRDVETIVLKAIEKDPRQRYPSAEAMAADLRRYLNDEPIQARRTGPAERAWRWCRRNPVVTGMTAAILLVMAIAQGLVYHEKTVAESERNTAQTERDDAHTARDEARAARDELRRTLYASQMNLVQSAYEAGNASRALNILDQQWPKGGEPDLRGFEWHYWRRQCRGDQEPVTLRERPKRSALQQTVFSSNGQFVATATTYLETHRGEQQTIKLQAWDANTGRLHFATQMEDRRSLRPTRQPAFSPDGATIAMIQAHPSSPRTQLLLRDARTGRVKASINVDGMMDYVSFHHDGRRITGIVQSGDRNTATQRMKTWDASTGQEVAAIELERQVIGAPVFGADGGRVAFLAASNRNADSPLNLAERTFTVTVFDAISGRIHRSMPEPIVDPLTLHDGESTLVGSRDGRWLASATSDGSSVTIWNAETGQVQCRPYIRDNPTDAVNAGGKTHLVFSDDSARVGIGGTWSPSVGVWHIESGRLLGTLKSHTGRIAAIAFINGGARICALGRDQAVRTWQVPATSALERSPLISLMAVGVKGRRVAVYDSVGSTAARTPELSIRETENDRVVARVDWSAISAMTPVSLTWRRADQWAFSNDEEFIIVPADDRQLGRTVLRVIEVRTGKVAKSISMEQQIRAPIRLAMSDDGRRLTAAWQDSPAERPLGANERVTRHVIWDFASGNELIDLSIGRGESGWAEVRDPWAISRDGTMFATSINVNGQTVVRLWDVDAKRELRDIPTTSPVMALAFGPSGRGVLVMTEGEVDQEGASAGTAYSTTTGEVLTSVRGMFGLTHRIAFSADGQRLAIAAVLRESPSGEVKLWDMTSQRELMTLRLPEMYVRSLHFSPDSHKLILLSDRTGVTIWDGTPLPASSSETTSPSRR